MAKVRICRESRRFVQDRFAHHSTHRFARLAIPRFEVLTDFRVPNLLEALGSELCMGEQRAEFEQRKAICRKHVERIAEQLIGSCAEVVQAPALFQNRCELGDADEVR